ncbi:unnamed protein product [Rangifer tarandus platyrhynchus]|uniref:Uncharacterized protein n=1 Tax=Rangifer tarandus platyrhynchus TaxID=3082113 RepID=A0ABN8XM03_RANTA|nr:unnamed protein product [Rangifer tarandus platyrhynchus]
MTPRLGTLRTTHPTRTPHRPPHGGLRRELHGGRAVVAKERETQDTGQERRPKSLCAELPRFCHMLARPALLNCWGQNRSDGGCCSPALGGTAEWAASSPARLWTRPPPQMEQRCTQVLTSPIHCDVLLGQSLLTATCLSLFISSECADVAIRHDLPRVFTGNGAAHGQKCPGEHPPSDPRTELPLCREWVVCRMQRRVCVTQTDGKKFTGVSAPGSCLGLLSGGSRSEAGDHRSGGSKLQHSSLARVPGGRNGDRSWVFNGNNGMSCRQKFLPGSLRIPNVDALTFPSVDVLLHWEVKVGAT